MGVYHKSASKAGPNEMGNKSNGVHSQPCAESHLGTPSQRHNRKIIGGLKLTAMQHSHCGKGQTRTLLSAGLQPIH